jgi:hypothetical protein
MISRKPRNKDDPNFPVRQHHYGALQIQKNANEKETAIWIQLKQSVHQDILQTIIAL